MSTSPLRRQVDLPRSPEAGRTARAAVDDLRAQLGAEATRTARLLVSELAANAYRHGTGRIWMTIEIDLSGTARFAVHDEGEATPSKRDAGGPDGGFGLQLVESLAARWGVVAGSTHVWFELSIR